MSSTFVPEDSVLYLKEIEMVGFKSFADKTKMAFEPGMTCIVGPNGCGKSNVSDAIRWVLGEQSAKALRGGKMLDVIFSGTDTHKPLSAAEVSLTLADCGKTLDLEYEEVRVTRRVLRSGEGQYFINKAPCRLKDIQRLFMDTGVGTNSYSVMEQGKIDQILSSRPDDRRAIFEEASGITRYKADRKEAMRKLDQTEANLLRLDDIIREVKRQIGSLQRQAGKARRYKTMQTELRGLDVFATRERIKGLDDNLKALANQVESLKEQDEGATAELEKMETRLEELRKVLAGHENAITQAMDTFAEVQSRHDRALQSVQNNRERGAEMQGLLERDSKDADEARRALAQHRESLTTLEQKRQEDEKTLQGCQVKHDTEAASLRTLEEQVETTRNDLHNLRGRAVDFDGQVAQFQNELTTIEAQEHGNTLRRERLSAEKSQVERSVHLFADRERNMEGDLSSLRESMQHSEQAHQQIEQERQGKSESIESLQKRQRELEQQLTGNRTRRELLEQAQAAAEGYGNGARHLLEQVPERLSGSLADALKTDPEFSVALQAVLSATLDALVVDNQANGIDLLSMLAAGGHGRINLVLQETHDHGMQSLEGFNPLRELVQPSEGSEALADALLRETYLVDSLDALPSPLPPNACFVTRDGAVAHGNGRLSLWSAEEGDSNPMARQQKLDELNAEQAVLQTALDAVNREIQTSTGQQESLQVRLTSAASALQEARRVLAVKEGEAQVIQGEATGARKRQETVGFELQALIEQTSEGSGRREELASKIEEKRRELTEVRGTIQSRTESLRIVEDSRAKQLNEFSEQRVLLSEARQRLQQLDNQLQSQKSRIQELEHLIENRSKGADTYQQKIQSLQDSSKAIEEEIPELLEQLKKEQDRLQELRNHRQTGTEELRTMEGELRGRRHHADELRAKRNLLQIEQTEKSTRRQAAFERLASDYNVSLEDIMGAPEPEWEEGVRPDKDKLETRIAELKTKLESMGPVNLVAIEEHQELEERFAFLTQQQQDLINAKTQLIEMIKKINATTTELFKTTFDQVNEHFAITFTRLFGGGSAKLILLDEEDILESGIEIIARPPGKKLQTISLLSGGERTMTAVALLFALFKVKPSPFCVLDEIDAALDESNIGRFVEMVQDYLSMSQFVVISHSRKTIAAADVLYGVTMQTQGISKIVSVKMNDGKKEPELIDAPAVATT